jgi:hypothetical protein
MIRASHFYFLTGCRNSHQWRLVGFVCGGTVHQYAAIVRRQDDRWRDEYHHCRSFADTSINLTSKIEAFYARHSVERNLLLVLNRIQQLSQVKSCFSQLRMNPRDFRGSISAWELYLDSFNAAVFSQFRSPELNAIVGADCYGL